MYGYINLHIHKFIQVAAVPLVRNTSRAGAASLMLRVLPRQSTCCTTVCHRPAVVPLLHRRVLRGHRATAKNNTAVYAVQPLKLCVSQL